MNDPSKTIARAMAQLLEDERPGVVADVEAALAARQHHAAQSAQYVDPVALGSLIVSIASLAWTVYAGLRERTAEPTVEAIADGIRRKMREEGQATVPDHVIEVATSEVIRIATYREYTQEGPN